MENIVVPHTCRLHYDGISPPADDARALKCVVSKKEALSVDRACEVSNFVAFVAEPEGSTTLTPKPVIGHDPEPVT
jgi:hypothetical protein